MVDDDEPHTQEPAENCETIAQILEPNDTYFQLSYQVVINHFSPKILKFKAYSMDYWLQF